jgi:hypothetical protein
MKAAFFTSLASLGLVLTLSGCDSTPRERQEIVRQEMTKLDTAAHNTGRTLRRLGRQTARFDSANHARRAEPLAPAKQLRMDQELLGSYANQLPSLTPATIAGAYGQLLRATRVRQASWQARDWDYARTPTVGSMPSSPAFASTYRPATSCAFGPGRPSLRPCAPSAPPKTCTRPLPPKSRLACLGK